MSSRRNISAIPTLYKGTRYRSRLEARWAAFFDLLGWQHAYEPLDLRGYIPDFLLLFPAGNVLVEVKPDMSLKNLEDHADKILQSGWKQDALIVGARIFESNAWQYASVVGLFLEYQPADGQYQHGHLTSEAPMFECESCGQISFVCLYGRWGCQRCGQGQKPFDDSEFSMGDAMSLWNGAGNLTQWKPEP